MSFDLFFYQPIADNKSQSDIAQYLSENLTTKHEEFDQWFFENERTGVYYLFEFDEPKLLPEDDPEDTVHPKFYGCSYSGFSFNLNFGRPDFFGREAFIFVEKFINDLGLSVFDPQSSSETDTLTRPTGPEMCESWIDSNRRATGVIREQDPNAFVYFPPGITDAAWNYNFNADRLQAELGDEYYVPTILFLREKKSGNPVTAVTWNQHIPNVFPPVDFVFLIREYRKLFRAVKETGVISNQTFLTTFREFLKPFHFKDCRIIYPATAALIGKQFNSINFEHLLKDFEGLPVAQLTNVPD